MLGNLIFITIFAIKKDNQQLSYHMKKENKDLIIEDNPYFNVLEFDYDAYEQSNRKRWFYKLKCKTCGTVFTKRKDAIVYMPDKIRCPKCYKNRHGVLSVLEYDMLTHYKSNARQRNIKWNLTDEQFKNLITQNCHYCGAEPHFRKTTTYKQNKEKVNGIDRINSLDYYHIKNVVPCCMKCNKMKMDLSEKDFRQHIAKIYNHMIKSSTTISQESTLQANGSGNGSHLINKDEDIVSTSMET